MSKERIFRFKQFSVSHSSAAMKVGTDGVLLGAWTPVPSSCQTIWDIGGGSGLIALMLAQRQPSARLFSIEIMADAAREMACNFAASPWADRLKAVEGNIFDVVSSLPRPDLIVSNPPFFANSLSAPDAPRSTARHEASLGFESLIALASSHLSDHGVLSMISPADRREQIEWFAALHRLNILKRMDVITVEGRAPLRILWHLGRQERPMETSQIIVRDASGEYSDIYRCLTEDFYIHL